MTDEKDGRAKLTQPPPRLRRRPAHGSTTLTPSFAGALGLTPPLPLPIRHHDDPPENQGGRGRGEKLPARLRPPARVAPCPEAYSPVPFSQCPSPLTFLPLSLPSPQPHPSIPRPSPFPPFPLPSPQPYPSIPRPSPFTLSLVVISRSQGRGNESLPFPTPHTLRPHPAVLAGGTRPYFALPWQMARTQKNKATAGHLGMLKVPHSPPALYASMNER